MSNYNYEDVLCPHCKKIERIRFTIKQFPFCGSTDIVSEGVRQCFYCKEYYMPTVKIFYGARTLNKYEQTKVDKSK